MCSDELSIVQWMRDQQASKPWVPIGIGDDMAMIALVHREAAPTDGRLLISSDMLLDTVHFDTSKHRLAEVGRKAIACGLSDCAAMAVRPLCATVSLALPRSLSGENMHALLGGMMAMADEFDLAIVGGDTTRWDHPLAIDVAVTATPFAGIEPITRTGAKPGDGLYVTGPLGGSLLGKHLTFTPRVAEARALAEHFGDRLHAMLDITDGLSLDTWRMCHESDVGATLCEEDLERVVSDDARRASIEDGRSPLEHVLSDGEDFELLLAISGDTVSAPRKLYRVGQASPDGLKIRNSSGRERPLEPKGYVH